MDVKQNISVDGTAKEIREALYTAADDSNQTFGIAVRNVDTLLENLTLHPSTKEARFSVNIETTVGSGYFRDHINISVGALA